MLSLGGRRLRYDKHVHAHRDGPVILCPPLRSHAPGESWQGGRRAIWMGKAELLRSKAVKYQAPHAKDPRIPHIPAGPHRAETHTSTPRPPPTSSHHQPASLTSSLSGTSSRRWHSWLLSACPSDAGATCCPPNPPDPPGSQTAVSTSCLGVPFRRAPSPPDPLPHHLRPHHLTPSLTTCAPHLPFPGAGLG